MEKSKKSRTASGMSYHNHEDSMTVGQRGPVLLQDFIFQEKLVHFD